MIIKQTSFAKLYKLVAGSCAGLMLLSASAYSAVTLESSTPIANNALHFDGSDIDKLNLTTQQLQDDTKYHYKFGGNISAYGDAVKTYKHYVFMTWYRGGKDDRHVMLSRLNTKTGTVKTIEFPHRHTGYQGKWWIGESHNTIGLAVSPKNGTIHMVYDMHAYTDTNLGGLFKDDYFRYSYSLAGAAEVADEDFTLEQQFVKDISSVSQGEDDYKHLVMTKDLDDKLNFEALTYPKFYDTEDGDLIHYMRWGGNNNGAYYYNSYDADAEKWTKFVPFNHRNQKSHGLDHNWGLYGFMKYVNGKLRVGFQRRSSDNNDKYTYQNGIYYAYLDDPANNIWRDHTGKQITWPLVDADEIKIFEPGDLVATTSNAENGAGTPPGKVYIVSGFDWTLTEKGDLHFVHQVKDLENNVTVKAHTYKPAGATDFITKTGFAGGNLYSAGDDIYIIGVDGGKPYVEVAKGGTNNFERIYHAETGNFARGEVYIKDGKAYYYLMEQASGTERPIHLQVLDLGINTATVTFDESTVEVIDGYSDIKIKAFPTINNDELEIETVALYVDDALVKTLTAEPYAWSQADSALQNLAVGSYALKAVVTDNNGKEVEAFSTLNVIDPTPMVSFAQAAQTLTEGYQSLTVDVNASSPVSDRNIASVKLSIGETEVSTKTESPYQWTQADTGLIALAVGQYTLTAMVTDSEGLTSEATMTVTVRAQPVDNGGANSGGSGGGGGSTAPLMLVALMVLIVARKISK